MTQPPSSPKDKASQAYLAEYQALRQEVGARFDWQRQAFLYLATIAGAGATLITATKFATGDALAVSSGALGTLSLFVPLVAVPIAFIFFDNELMIWSIVQYLNGHLRSQIASLAEDDGVLQVEAMRFHNMGPVIVVCHQVLSVGRWIFFLVPTLGPTCYALIQRHSWANSGYSPLFWSLLLVDILLVLALVLAMGVAFFTRRQIWKGRKVQFARLKEWWARRQQVGSRPAESRRREMIEIFEPAQEYER